MNATKDFAERIRKFYYYRALFCEELISKRLTITDHAVELPPAEFNPSDNFYVDAYVIGCAAIDGLASVWQSINQSQYSRNRERFIAFLIRSNTQIQMERICTPFLVFFLSKQGIEKPFVQAVESEWLKKRCDQELHRVYDDPTISELKMVYENCHQEYPISDTLTLKNPDSAILSFTYAALIYKFYRCSFVHEFKASQFVTFFNRGREISVREFSHSISPSGLETRLNSVKPQLDVGIGVLTQSIREGADIIYDLLLEKEYTAIPYNSSDEFQFNVKSK